MKVETFIGEVERRDMEPDVFNLEVNWKTLTAVIQFEQKATDAARTPAREVKLPDDCCTLHSVVEMVMETHYSQRVEFVHVSKYSNTIKKHSMKTPAIHVILEGIYFEPALCRVDMEMLVNAVNGEGREADYKFHKLCQKVEKAQGSVDVEEVKREAQRVLIKLGWQYPEPKETDWYEEYSEEEGRKYLEEAYPHIGEGLMDKDPMGLEFGEDYYCPVSECIGQLVSFFAVSKNQTYNHLFQMYGTEDDLFQMVRALPGVDLVYMERQLCFTGFRASWIPEEMDVLENLRKRTESKQDYSIDNEKTTEAVRRRLQAYKQRQLDKTTNHTV